MSDANDAKEPQRQQKREAFLATLLEADEQISRGEFVDADEAFDQVEEKLFGKRLVDE